MEVCGSFIFPSNGSVFRCRPLLHRVPRVGSPASLLVLRHSDSPSPPLCSLDAHSAVSPCGDDDGASQVPGKSTCTHAPLLLTPVGRLVWSRDTSLFRDYRLLPSALPKASAIHDSCISRLSHAAYVLAVYASRSRLPVAALRPRKTRFRAVTNLTRAGFDPQDFSKRFPRFSISTSPSPGLA